jgi:CubicO group peptidase (beta-lactamase class C family)
VTELRDGTPEQAGMDRERIELIRERAAQWVDQPGTQGLVLLVARHGVVCLHAAWGSLTYRDDSPPIGTDALFHCGSLAKPVTATAAMILAEEGLLGLTRPINYYVPELTGAGTQDVLVQHLLTHTSGYDGEALPEALAAWLSEPRTFPDCPATQHPHLHRQLEALYPQDLAHPPGTLMSYCNAGYDLLGEVVRRVSGVSFEDFVAQRIFAPLGMGDSSFGLRSTQQNRFAERDADSPVIETFGGRDSYRRFVEIPFPAGGLFATTADYAIFAQTYLNGGHYGSQRILGEASVAQMTRNQIPGIPAEFLGPHPEGDWGYGFGIIGDDRWRMFDGNLAPNGGFGHGGLGGTAFWVDPVNDLIGIYFSVCGIDDVREEHIWEYDLFQNLVTAAIADEA